MRLRLWHKMIFIICVFSVLALSFVVSSGASSYYEGDGDVVYQPLFFPDIMTIHSPYPETICFDLNTSFCVDSNNGFNQFVTNIGVSDYTTTTNISVSNSVSSSAYGYSYIDASYVVELPVVLNDDFDYVSFTFPDLYLSQGVIGTQFFDSITIFMDIDGNELTTTYYCSWIESFIDNDGVFYTSARSAAFTGFTDLIYYYSSGDFPYGLSLSNIVFDIYIEGSNSINEGAYISGGSPCVSISDIPSPLLIWSDFFQPSTVIVNPPPLTILQSIEAGLNAVWNTSLFGLFTIGTVFSACAGVALFAWLLKIFNR